MLEAFGAAFAFFQDPTFLLFMLGGTIYGLIIGIVPGIGGLVAIALFLPFTFRLEPIYALAFMLSITAVNSTSGAITSILVNIPGESVNTATLLDGYPMARKGQAGRALGAALMSSTVGGIAVVFLALATIPLILAVIMAVHSAEMVFIVLMGLCFIGVVSGRSKVKGLISGGLGLLVSFIGYQPATGVGRFTLGSLYLYDGLEVVPVGLGLFAVSQVLVSMTEVPAEKPEYMGIKGFRQVWEGGKDVFRHWGLMLRCIVIGYVVGILPGIGSGAGTWISYGQAKKTSKHPEEFGTGCVEGVIAPQSVSNGTLAGDLLCTLALGIPGSSTMTLLIAAFLMMGIVPGPSMLANHLDMSLNLMLVIIASNIIGGLICFLLASKMAKVSEFRACMLAPAILVVSVVGVYAYKATFNDVIVTLVFGAIGFAMVRYGFSRAALLLGFILGALFEKYFFIASAEGGPLFFMMRPISLGVIFIIVLLFGYSPVKKLVQSKIGSRRAA